MTRRWLWVRVDDRLLHGQVVAMWLPYLNPRTVACLPSVDADKGFLTEVFRSILPAAVQLWVGSANELETAVQEGHVDPGQTLVILHNVRQAAELESLHLLGGEINLGCLAPRGVVRRLHPQVAVSGNDENLLHALSACGVRIIVQALPGDRARDWPGDYS